MFAGTFAPAGWMFCDGQLLPIVENETLFNLIGTTFGGDGQETFGLPDLRGRVPLHQGNGFTLGETGGAENVTLTVPQLPAHTHPLLGSQNLAADVNPGNRVVAQTGTAGAMNFVEDVTNAAFSAQAISGVGGSQPHENRQPLLVVSFIISLFGIFPPPS
jgi:microcystin-dependent protein